MPKDFLKGVKDYYNVVVIGSGLAGLTSGPRPRGSPSLRPMRVRAAVPVVETPAATRTPEGDGAYTALDLESLLDVP